MARRKKIECQQCKKPMSDGHFRSDGEGQFIFVHGASKDTSYPYACFCFSCAGFSVEKKRFLARADYIRQGLDFGEDVPNGIIADYLSSMGRYKEEEYMRGLGE